MRRHECVFTRRLRLSAGIACGCLVCLAGILPPGQGPAATAQRK
jgi:hypothetical protein